MPAYKLVTGFLRDHGVNIIMVDSDGFNDPLLPLWLEGGITGMYPWEVAAGEDVPQLARHDAIVFADKAALDQAVDFNVDGGNDVATGSVHVVLHRRRAIPSIVHGEHGLFCFGDAMVRIKNDTIVRR